MVSKSKGDGKSTKTVCIGIQRQVFDRHAALLERERKKRGLLKMSWTNYMAIVAEEMEKADKR